MLSGAQPVAAEQVVTIVTPGVATPSAFTDRDDRTDRSGEREPLDSAAVAKLAQQRTEELADTDRAVERIAQSKAVDKRSKVLLAEAKATKRERLVLAAQSGPAGAAAIAGKLPTNGKTCLPVRKYTVAARFGDVGSWSRYHTGFDFSAPVGTTIYAPAAGVVTNAGSGPASGWAGTYVTIQYPDGTQSLMAHMSTVTVKVGQIVSGCQAVGQIGMTGRSFGAHLHFEIYPAAVEPGDVYKAINPEPWLRARHLSA